jgi:hypothetical protein
MRAMRTLALVVGFGLSVLACSDTSSSPGSPDLLMSAPDLSFASKCGVPGDSGNALGVGKYCMVPGDCPSTAPICSKVFYPGTYFCTVATHCTPDATGMDKATCGDNTVCTRDPTLGTGCTPAKCAPTPQG